jgi:hypothetical protein
MTRPGVFLDRDGTLVEEVPYLHNPERLALLPGVGSWPPWPWPPSTAPCGGCWPGPGCGWTRSCTAPTTRRGR